MLFPRLVLPVWGCQFVVFGSLRFAWSGGVPPGFTTFYHFLPFSGKKVVSAGQGWFLGLFFGLFASFSTFSGK